MSLRINKSILIQSIRNHSSPRLLSKQNSVYQQTKSRASNRQVHKSYSSTARTSLPHSLRPLRPLPSSATLTALVFGIFFAGSGFAIWDSYTAAQETILLSPPEKNFSPTTGPTDPLKMPVSPEISTAVPPGRPGALTSEQEAKLKDLWYEIGKLCGQYTDAARGSVEGDRNGGSEDTSSTPGSGKKKRRFFGRKSRDSDSTYSGAVDDVEDKHGSNKEFKTALSSMSQEELRNSLWEFCKGDDPDANLCRYLRARKWNVHDALVMLISTIHWRERVMKLDQDVMRYGEEDAMLATEGRGNPELDPKMAEDMIKQLRMGKSFLHGVDKEGRPLCFVRVRLHKGGEFSNESLERLTVYMIETARFMLRPPIVDTAVIIFDMTSFSLANMDYSPVKFMIKVFEANYPESLGVVLVHKAPWVFQGIWSVIKGWLDPVVASKINFTKSVEELEQFIERGNIPKELGGDEDWTYKFVEPVEGENRQMADAEALRESRQERKQAVDQFEKATQEWVLGTGDEKEVQARRTKLSQAMRDTYWGMDPFIRSRSMYDRIGVIRPRGELDFYPSERPQPQPQSDGVDKKLGQAGGMFGGALLQSPNGTAQRSGEDAKSLKSAKSVYFDAQSDLD